MSLITDSPVHSSSSSGDDFVALLDAELDEYSSESAPHHDEDNDDEDYEEPQNLVDLENAPREEEDDADADADAEIRRRAKKAKVEVTDTVEEHNHSEASSSTVMCSHPGTFKNMCIKCGQMVDDVSGVSFTYIHKGLTLANDEVVRLRNSDVKNLLRNRKLYLILDLDHTLLNSTLLMHLTPDEEYLKSHTDSLQDVSNGSLFMFETMHMMTKLRPYIHTFLKEASQMFEMYIYTMGDRAYALEMAKLLDPRGEYFSSRVISRDDGTHRHQKGLDIVLGQENAVLILDDTENAWPKQKENLILMERYHFFASSCHQFGFNCKSLSELKSDESESDGALISVLKILRRVHHMFFDELIDDAKLDGRDVRQVLKTIRRDVLKGCKIIFSRAFPTHFQADNHHLWKMAEQLGAKCSTEINSSVTHVVSTDAGTEKSRWAEKNKKFLVYPRWIEAANYLWQKQPEDKFTVGKTENQ